MKRRVRPSRVLMLGCFLSALVYVLLVPAQERRTFAQSVQSEEASARETYVSEVIIEAPWGKENLVYAEEASAPGEFGMHEEFQEPGATEGLIIGPSTFTVAPNGDLYINDPLNKRIQRFGPNGEFISLIPIEGGFMCVDKDNNVYSTRASSPHWFIDKYDQGGNRLASYPIDIQRKSIVGIACDNLGRIFVEFTYSYIEVDKERQTLIDTTWDGVCQVGTSTQPFSIEEQRNSTRKHWLLGTNSAALDKGLFFQPSRDLGWSGYGDLNLVNPTGETVKVLNSLQGFLLGCDENLNVYTHQYHEEKHGRVVRKYNSKGELVSTFEYWCGKPYTGIFTLRGCAFLDLRGNLYVFCQSLKDGIQVTKWYKAE